jgi:glycoside/pentoside/hexuronide:cation symporter, GPH family
MARKLSLGTKLGFGVCDLGGNLFFTAMGFWTLNYLTDTVMLPAAAAGLAVMIGRVWDAVTDPMMGFISDRTRSRWGRRRPYLLFGAIPLFLTMWLFFSIPAVRGNVAIITAWTTLALCLLNTAYTVVNIPYSALTPEMTSDYHERSSLNGFRFSFAVIGTIAGAGVVLPIVNAFSSKGAGFSVMGAAFGALMALTAFITFLSVREPGHETAERPTEGFFKTYKVVFSNKPYVIILLTYALNITAINLVQGILVYYFKYLFRNEGAVTLAMILLLLVAMASIPVSVLFSKKIGKKRTYQISFAIIALSCMTIFFFGHLLGMAFFYGIMIFAGIGIGFGYVAPWAMIPDTVEYDAIKTGKRKEGAFYGMWTFTSKTGTALAILLTGGILSLAKYVPEAIQTPQAIMAIRLIVGPIPALVFLGALILVQFYPLDEKAYAALLEEKAKKEAEAKKA